MTVAASQTIGAILDHYADVIEGGNAYAAGSSYRGIPGAYSFSEHVGTITASANGSTTALVASGVAQATGHHLARSNGPRFFARCATATNGANIGAARRITAYTPNTLTVDAFPAATTASDTFIIQEGFKRAQDNIPLDDEEAGIPDGFDRSFALSLDLGERLDMAGAGTVTYNATLRLRLRLLKHSRAHEIAASAATNVSILRAILTRGGSEDHRDGTYMRALLYPQGEPEVIEVSKTKIVIEDAYPAIVRMQRAHP